MYRGAGAQPPQGQLDASPALFSVLAAIAYVHFAPASSFGGPIVAIRWENDFILGKEKLNEAGIALPLLPRFNRRDYTDKAALAAARKEHQRKLRERRKQISKLAREHGKAFAAYDLRHGFCQRLLENGANHLAVAELMGHANGQMVSQVYSHMHRADAHLRDTLKKASSEGAEA